MALTGLQTNWQNGSYLNDRDRFIKENENLGLANGSDLSGLRPHFDGRDDGRGSIAIGYGFDLLVNDNTTINNSLTEANGQATTLTAADITLLAQARARRNARTATGSYLIGVASQLSVSLISEPAATTLLDLKLIQYEAALDGALGGLAQLASSKERIAIISLLYTMTWPNANAIADTIPSTIKAIQNDNRAEAWYEIRYNSNADNGHTARRYQEADLFGLYDGGTLTADEQTAEAKEIMRMYTRYEVFDQKLSTYEGDHTQKPANSIDQEVQRATNYLVTNFAMGNTIDGWVIVGQGLDSYNYIEKGNWKDNIEGNVENDLIFGEKGNDKLNGAGGNDVIYGGEGDDVLIGGMGNDTLMGGENYDTYIINAGDGNDTIEDKEGINTVILCGKELNFFYNTGDGETYKSYDGW